VCRKCSDLQTGFKKLLKEDADGVGYSYKKFVVLGGGQENDCGVLITMFLPVLVAWKTSDSDINYT
jgi:hypothetical protein